MLSAMSQVFYRSKQIYPVAQRAKGIYIWDTAGQRYLDGSSGALVCNIGHGRTAVAEAMAQQALQLDFVHGSHFSSDILENYAAQLVDFVGLPTYRYWAVSGGSEANESAIKLARQCQLERGQAGRYKIISRVPSYHGSSLGALAVSGVHSKRHPYTALMKPSAWPKMPKPDPSLCGPDDAERLRQVLKEADPSTVAAFICEPVIGASGAALAPKAGYHQRIAQICHEYGVLFIVDEVMCGMGRCGQPLAVQLDQPYTDTPDIVVLGKGLAAGYAPLAGLLVRPEIYDSIMQGSGIFKNGFTYSGHPISIAAGLSVLQVLKDEQLTVAAQQRGQQLLAGLKQLQKQSPHIVEVRGKGLLLGIVLGSNADPQAAPAGLAQKLAAQAREVGLLVYPGSGSYDGIRGEHLLLGPPLSISATEIDDLLELLQATFEGFATYATNKNRADQQAGALKG